MSPSTLPRKSISFALEPQIRLVQTVRRRFSRRSTVAMASKLYLTFKSEQVTDAMLEEAAKLFSENYGVWGEQAAERMGKFAKAGARVRLSKERLRNDYLLSDMCTYVKVIVNDELAGNAFACRWSVGGKTICWVTQLVVHRDYRERGLAAGLLDAIQCDDDEIFGVMSSHPAACLAASRAFRRPIDDGVLDFMKNNAQSIMEASPIRYIQSARLRGKLFDSEACDGLVSCVDTGFFVDHSEPLEALAFVQDTNPWPLGDLLDGHEFILILQAKRRARSVSSQSQRGSDQS